MSQVIDDKVRERWARRAETAETRAALETVLPHLEVALRRVGEPQRVLAHFDRMMQVVGAARLLPQLAAYPRAADKLVTLFASSPYLSDILLANADDFTLLLDRRKLTRPKTVSVYRAEALAGARGLPFPEQLLALRRYQRRQILRIGACDLWGFWDLERVTRQLSLLAEALVQAALSIAADACGIPPTGFAVLALGKLGGRELNYSSDIDLLFLVEDDSARYTPLAERLIDVLSRITEEGFLYRVDMRLRPWGRTGPLVTSVPGYLAYLERHARAWEKQALLKARPIAGDRGLAARVVRALPRFIFTLTADQARTAVREMKERIEEELRRRGREWGEVKLGEGSIRDVEFVVQYLQLVHGGRHPGVRGVSTRRVLERLHAHGFLSEGDYRVLLEGYTFLRTVEHHLQLMHNRQTHILPADPAALDDLARRLGYEGEDAAARLVRQYEQHREAIRQVWSRHLEDSPAASRPVHGPPRVQEHVLRMTPSYRQAFDADTLARHADMAARLGPDNLAEVEARPLTESLWEVTLVAYDYLGELSLITGLLFVYGMNIIEGQVFTYEESPAGGRRKIVDVFIVRPVRGRADQETWQRYRDDLAALLAHLEKGQWETAHRILAHRFVEAMSLHPDVADVLYPVDVEIDNETSDRYTILRIDATDTVGFLYEFTSALALNNIYIARVDVQTVGTRVRDTLWVTDREGRKITSPQRQQELRAATVLVKHFTHLLPRAPDPEAALTHFRQFLADLFARPGWHRELATLQAPATLEALARLLGVSHFLWDDFLRLQYEQLFPVLREVVELDLSKSKSTLWFEVRSALEQAESPAARRDALNAFKDREMFRIDMRYILGRITFEEFSAALTDLAEVVVEAAFRLCREELTAQYGHPLRSDGSACPAAVFGLGKLGGREMGFASDIELMFVYDDSGHTSGPDMIPTSEFFERLVERFLHTIRARREGVFEVDLQLRPYGKAGSLAVSRRAFEEYFRPGGPAWPYERQALIRLRAIAGDPEFGRRIEALRDTFVYSGQPFDADAMRAMRERQLRHLVHGGTLNAKFSPGGLVDIEYLVQGLQITYGLPYPELRTPNTAEAMAVLADLGILSAEDHHRLREAHLFLRRLIEALRVVRGHAKDLTVPPPESEAFAYLARRMEYGRDVQGLYRDLLAHMAFVRELQARFF